MVDLKQVCLDLFSEVTALEVFEVEEDTVGKVLMGLVQGLGHLSVYRFQADFLMEYQSSGEVQVVVDTVIVAKK